MAWRKAALLAATALWAPAVAFAQAPAAPQGGQAPAEADEAGVAEVVVTGSRLQAAGFEAPTPVTTLDTASLAAKAPSNLPDALNQLPVFSGSVSQYQARDSQANTVRAGNYLNLRALGPQRLLLLQDGIRVPATSNNGGADANLIPQMLIRRVEIVTGGASAAYGSDAVSGVVNFVLDRNYEGLRVQGQRGIASRGDNESYKVGAAAGRAFLDGKLHLLASAEHYESDGIPHRSDRGGADNQLWANIGTGFPGSPIQAFNNARVNSSSFGGLVQNGPFRGQQFLPGGQLGPFNPGTVLRAGLGINGEGFDFAPDLSTLIGRLQTTQVFGRVGYDFSDNLRGYVQASYAEAASSDAFSILARNNVTIFRENAFLQPAVLAALGNTASFTINRGMREAGALPAKQSGDNLLVVAGLEGNFGEGWKWSANYTHADSKFRSKVRDQLNREFFAGVDAVRNAAGQIVCRITITNPGLMDNCVPINLFGAGSLTQREFDFFVGEQRWSTDLKTRGVAFDISGTPFATWAGDVAVAVGAEYRRQSLVQISNADPTIPQDYTGIRNGTGPRFNTNNVGTADGKYNVKEVYAEIGVPLAKDMPFAAELGLNGAVRYTDYSTSGSVWTWKAGATYSPVEAVRFRGVLSRDIRAPTLFELFSRRTQGILGGGFFDPLTQLGGQITIIGGGNPNLKPEIGETLSVGVVLTNAAVPGLQASLDYYKIKIKDAIAAPFTAPNIIDLCFASGGTSSLCSLVDRPINNTDRTPANFPRSVTINQQNVAELSTDGLDGEISYRRPAFDGDLTLRVLARRLISFERQESDASALIDYAGVADFPGPTGALPLPKWQGSFEVTYTRGPLTLNLQERFIGKFQRSNLLIYEDNDVPAMAYTDVSVRYTFEMGPAEIEAFLTVNNLFDAKAPTYISTSNPGIQTPAARNVHDIVGTYATTGITLRW